MKTIKIIALLTIHVIVTQSRAQDEWYKIYENALTDLENCRWQHAIKPLEQLIRQKSTPNLREPTYGIYYEEYLPYYHLGRAYFFTEQYTRALECFQLSEKYRVIQASTVNYRMLQSLKNTAEKILLALAPDTTTVKQSEFSLEKKDSILFNFILHDEYDQALNFLQELTGSQQLNANKTLEQNEKTIAFYEKFNQALDAYLIGDYNSALARFANLTMADPTKNLVSKWIKKTRSELRELKPLPKLSAETDSIIIEKIVTQTVAPVFALRTPATEVIATRSENITIAGVVADDEGIDRVEMTVNGALFKDSQNKPFRLRPATAREAKKFPFQVKIPLQPGKNQIVLVAYDADSSQHSEVLPVTVVRKLPIYRTLTFAIVLITLVLVIIGMIVISKIIKYRIAIVNKYNPYIAGAPILTDSMFFGRDQLLNSIMNTLHHNSLMLYGPRRIGKTSIQHQIKRRLEAANDPEYHYIPVYIDLQGIPEEKFFLTMIEDILEACNSYLGQELDLHLSTDDPGYDGRKFAHDLKSIITYLCGKISKNLRLVLLMDEVDQLNHYSERVNQRLRSIFMKTFAEKLVAVMAGTHIRKKWDSEGSPWYNFFEEIEIPPLRPEEARALIMTPVQGIFYYDNQAIEKILHYSNSEPFLVQKFCIHAINKIIAARRRRVTAEDIDTIRQQVFEESD